MNFIEKHSKILAVSLCLLTSGPIVSTMYAKEVQPGWHGEGADRYYVLKSNRQTATGLTKIDKELYYFNNKGEIIKISNKLLELIVDLHDEEDFQVRVDYSGRGMFGEKCLGIVGSDTTTVIYKNMEAIMD